MNTFKTGFFPEKKSGVKAIPRIYRESKNIFLVIARKKNGNVVVYEAITDKGGHLLDIECYWMDLEPSYRAKHRAKGTDRVNMSKMDMFAYGYKIAKKRDSKVWEMKFKQFPKETMVIESHDKGVSCYRYLPDGRKQKVHHLFLHDRQVLNAWPTVDLIDVVGFNDKTKKVLKESIKP